MQITRIRIQQEVRHPDHDGIGNVMGIFPDAVEVLFNDGKRRLDQAEIAKLKAVDTIDLDTLSKPLKDILHEVVESALSQLEKQHQSQEGAVQLANKWNQGTLRLQPGDPQLAPKEVPLETFFHKIVMVRDNLRVLEQKINSHPQLTDENKVEMQQYITRMAGSLTTFNILFKDKEEQF